MYLINFITPIQIINNTQLKSFPSSPWDHRGDRHQDRYPGVGLAKAKKFWFQTGRFPASFHDIKNLPDYLKMPGLIVSQDYIEKFLKANNTFLYQLVYDPQSRTERPLTPYPESLAGKTDELEYCGSYSAPDLATQMGKKDKIVRMKIEFASEIPEEPEPEVENVVRVCIKLPGGQRLDRR